MELPLTCPTEADLHQAGYLLGQEMKAGSLVALIGDLGAGKTHLTKGLVQGLGCEEVVTSPTFSLVQEYHGGRVPVYHFDFYRLQSEEELFSLGWDDYLEAGGVVIAEWANLFPDFIPADALRLRIAKIEGGRRIERYE
ncbi:MAG: tRNA (adenosine(37)-N6)-threonylcarbamoyltransferase complex ATPase subunit type 1 TsaE [Verrucomicrobiota bacterium JB023]|nr:tRNA (adenosine(37)-N6)-threonylcarbamoyltransferase complex ATPase subunit type 1 TsaE [Verrucomicrobiota bacterium JB023]